MTTDLDTARAARIDAFLARAGLGAAERRPLPGDASTRRYVRLVRAGAAPLMLMDAPQAAESAPAGPDADAQARRAAGYNALARLSAGRVEAFAAVAAWLRGLGLSAPEVVAWDGAAGLAVLEDLGDELYARRIEAGEAAGPLYTAAVDVLVRLHREAPPEALPVRGGAWPLLTYDALALQTGVDLFLDWWPRYAGLAQFGEAARADWKRLWAPVQAQGEAGATAFTHRDYHAENLLWLPDRTGLARVGLLDFQDAVRAHPAWDLLSLLQDARRDVEPDLEAAMLARYLAVAGASMDRDLFLADYAGLAALNNARIAGLFARLVVRDGKPRYRAFLPRMGRLLTRNLAHPELAGLKAWFERHVPEGVGA